jgi:hypothetical protein
MFEDHANDLEIIYVSIFIREGQKIREGKYIVHCCKYLNT